MEAHADDFCEEVDCVSVDSLAPARLALRAACGSLPRGSPASGGASAVAFGPSPVGVFDDKAGEGAELEVIGFALGEGEAALLQHGRQRDEAGGTDLFAGPSGVVFIGERCHGLFSSEVE